MASITIGRLDDALKSRLRIGAAVLSLSRRSLPNDVLDTNVLSEVLKPDPSDTVIRRQAADTTAQCEAARSRTRGPPCFAIRRQDSGYCGLP